MGIVLELIGVKRLNAAKAASSEAGIGETVRCADRFWRWSL